ncbi:effector-associated constant component EACC1 [Actinomadura rupiterrae]|uniref:effector-associated constant component EACC1 n=1 Tax=Actinomadura rupiterrae TaxID=559627 RepID=UPI0020A2C928|nr:hypothetical protein [Actinomadura rupiterrae]MCP2335944.1 hypothetical protein [Actinomadura rupiterrae]
MDARIKVNGGDTVQETAGLFELLRGDRALTGRVRAEPAPPREGELGGATDVLVVALGSGGAAAALTNVLVAWVKTRRPDVSVTVTTPRGSVKIDTKDLPADAVLPLLREALHNDDA